MSVHIHTVFACSGLNQVRDDKRKVRARELGGWVQHSWQEHEGLRLESDNTCECGLKQCKSAVSELLWQNGMQRQKSFLKFVDQIVLQLLDPFSVNTEE